MLLLLLKPDSPIPGSQILTLEQGCSQLFKSTDSGKEAIALWIPSVKRAFHCSKDCNEPDKRSMCGWVVMVYCGHRRKSSYFFQTRFQKSSPGEE
jgi:hypothetical protein